MPLSTRQSVLKKIVMEQHNWRFRNIRFNTRFLAPREGELVLDALNLVEDTKGAQGAVRVGGSLGRLSITNLRVRWKQRRQHLMNMSIGLGCVSAVKVRTVRSLQQGDVHQLMLMTKEGTTWREFVFSSPAQGAAGAAIARPRVFATIQRTHRAFATSTLYRDVKLRGAIIRSGSSDLILLPNEQIFSRTEGVMNLATDFGNLVRVFSFLCYMTEFSTLILLC